jgi:hypothetical protein
MFYCDECATERKYPLTIFKSLGKCELCGICKPCNEVAAKNLPMPLLKGRNYDGSPK